MYYVLCWGLQISLSTRLPWSRFHYSKSGFWSLDGESKGNSWDKKAICWVPSLHQGASLLAKMVKNLPAMQEAQIWSLGWEDPLEKGMATHSSILAWRIPWMEEPGGLQSTGSLRVGHDWLTNIFTFTFFFSPAPGAVLGFSSYCLI